MPPSLPYSSLALGTLNPEVMSRIVLSCGQPDWQISAVTWSNLSLQLYRTRPVFTHDSSVYVVILRSSRNFLIWTTLLTTQCPLALFPVLWKQWLLLSESAFLRRPVNFTPCSVIIFKFTTVHRLRFLCYQWTPNFQNWSPRNAYILKRLTASPMYGIHVIDNTCAISEHCHKRAT
jgi:hypothetical protein